MFSLIKLRFKNSFCDEKEKLFHPELQNIPSNLHKGSKNSGIDIQDAIDKSPCAELYYVLEECLGEYERDWKKCQIEVNSF